MPRDSDFLIGTRRIGLGHPPLIIAEMSGNHNQSLDRALALVDAAGAAGVHALKIQTYTADTMTLDIDEGEFLIDDQDSPWKGDSLYRLYQRAHTPWEWHKAIFDRCREHGMIGFSTPFDSTAVDFLESLDTPCYKIASFENVDLALIRRVASTGKPILISTGLASVAELFEAVEAARGAGSRQLVVLKCTSSYPAPPRDSNLATIPHMRQLLQCEVGLSDHTLGIGVAVASVALGATVIEKHFTLRRSDGGVDAAFSLEPDELASLVVESQRAAEAVGEIRYGPCPDEQKSLQFRRSLYVTRDLRAGEVLSLDNVRAIRPGLGLAPKFLEVIIGRHVTRDVKRGAPVVWDILSH